ncbi:Sugar kinase, ribokinase family [Halapricum desulfuricans]|uniref:Sugar kinase, ribokinase family n=2 Tax=Halapricum desulfuricans TaxID=2841257 RepID=A0A897NQU5_9EURY|nr:Sugar kinase, ribokinase family [Halapricum desulfuricans]
MSEYEAGVYLALVRGGTQTMTELAETSDVPKQRVYDTVEQLRNEGFVEVIDDYPQKAHAIEPSEALAPVQTKLNQAEEYLDDLYETIDTVEKGVTTFKSRPSIEKYISNLIAEAERDIFVLGPQDVLNQFRDQLKRRADDGVRITLVVSGLDESDIEDDVVTVPEFTDVGTRVRGVTTVEDFAITTDRRKGFYWAGSARRGVDELGYFIVNDDLAFVLDRFMSESLWPFAFPTADQSRPELPGTYVRIRDALADLEHVSNVFPLDTFVVEIEGYDTETGEHASLAGVPVSYYYNEYDLRASLTVEIHDDEERRRVTVGGWTATIEDYEVRQISIGYRHGEPTLSLDDETKRHLATCRNELPASFGDREAVIGIDAFIDRMRDAVAERIDGEYRPMRHFEEFQNSLARVDAGESALVEWTETRTEPGGYLSHAGRLFDNLGYDLTLVGRLGEPVSSVFAGQFGDQNLVTVGETSVTDFLLLEDKKILFTEPNRDEPTWESILDRVTLEDLARWIDGSAVLSIGSFYATSNLPAILDGLREEVWPMLQSPPPAAHVSAGELHRLPEGRLGRVVKALERLDEAVPVTVTANRRAATALRGHLCDASMAGSTAELAKDIARSSDVSRVIIHSFTDTVAASDGTVVAARKPLPPDPREGLDVSEYFETGVALALAEGLSDGAALVLGNAVAFYFNQHSEFPTESELRSALEQYEEYFDDDQMHPILSP